MAQLSVDEIQQLIKRGFVFGDKNQVLAADGNNSSTARYINMLSVGTFVSTDAQLSDAKTRYVNQATIFGQWKRGSYGLDTAGLGNPVPSNTIPGVPAQTNSWDYNAGTDTINSTLNSSSYITFVNADKYNTFTLDVTLGASGSDNDYIGVVIAYVEDENDMVLNNAYGLNPATYPGINTTDQYIPNQHTLSLIRGRTTQNDFPFHNQNTRYAIVYDLCKSTEQVLVNGEDLAGMVNMTADFGAGAECDARIVRDGDLIKTYTTNWSDGAGGKGALGHELSFDLSSNSITNKFRGAAAYGFGALSQKDAFFKNISSNPNRNTIYDIRDGSVWVANNSGVYALASSRSLYDDYGVNRFFYNPTTLEAYYVNADKTWELIGGGAAAAASRFGIEDNTSDVDRTVNFGDNALDIIAGTSDYSGLTTELFMQKGVALLIVQDGNNSFATAKVQRNSFVAQAQQGAESLLMTLSPTEWTVLKNRSDVFNVPLTVNGVGADQNGNITIAGTGGGTSTTLSDNLTTTTTGTALDAHQGSVIKDLVDGKAPASRKLKINGTEYDLTQDREWTISAGVGSVTSVALQMDNVIFNTAVTNSPVTGSGTLTPTLKTQAIKTFLAAPATGSAAAPTFRTITNADIADTTGLLTNLATTDKTLLVNAINEVLSKVAANYITQNQKISSLAINSAQSII